jgi:hypothetical protein
LQNILLVEVVVSHIPRLQMQIVLTGQFAFIFKSKLIIVKIIKDTTLLSNNYVIINLCFH